MAGVAPLIAHLERYLGQITDGWSETASGDELAAQVVRFRDASGWVPWTFATLGLSDHVLAFGDGREGRQELLCCGRDDPPGWEVASLMDVVARDIVASHVGLLRGQVLGPAGPVVDGSRLEALYCSFPMFWPSELAQFDGLEPPVTIVWLVPISAGEAAFVRDRGWDSFEDMLVERDPDLRDWFRPSLV